MYVCVFVFILLLFFKNLLFILERERPSAIRGGRERGGWESEAGSKLRAVSTEPNAGLELTNCKIMT